MKNLPSKADLIRWIEDNPTRTSKRDIGKAFGIKGAARIELKAMLKELTAEGVLEKRGRTFSDPGELPPVAVLAVLAPDAQGDLFAEPVAFSGDGAPPRVIIIPKKGDPALGAGDRILARLAAVEAVGYAYEGRLIRRIGSGPSKILGLYRKHSEGGRVVPIDKKSDREWIVPDGAAAGARDGELVEAEQTGPKARMGLPRAKIVARLGDPMAPKMVSLFAIHTHGIPDDFPEEVLVEAEAALPVSLGTREDLTHLPLITIDPPDARDRDDAVYVHLDDDPANEGGFVIWVAIADVAHYVTPGSRLDREARLRGNSTYFPDRVVPMLPDNLSGNLCSLHEGVPRACLAVRMVIDAKGKKIAHRFTRGLMNSRAALSYLQVQNGRDGTPDDVVAPLMDEVIAPLYAAYEALGKERNNRQPLHLDLPERRIELSEDGKVASVAFRDRFDAHKLIEEYMILANVAAAETLEQKRQTFLYRVHEEPNQEKLKALRDVAQAAGLVMAKGQVLQTRHLNKLLDAAAGTVNSEVINMSVLRSMTQAYYGPQNLGHFGLNLKRYAHFTSPIRRYADLIVHRALISGHRWGEDGLSVDDIERMTETGEQISLTERRSMVAERDTNDRYLASYLSERVGNEFEGRISGIARFGLFARLDETGADGLIPISSLGREYFHHDEKTQTLRGEKSGIVLKLGQKVGVRLAEAVPVTGGLMFELLTVEGEKMPDTGTRGGGVRTGRKVTAKRSGKSRNRKVSRKRATK
jgi:ribonuclease R